MDSKSSDISSTWLLAQASDQITRTVAFGEVDMPAVGFKERRNEGGVKGGGRKEWRSAGGLEVQTLLWVWEGCLAHTVCRARRQSQRTGPFKARCKGVFCACF